MSATTETHRQPLGINAEFSMLLYITDGPALIARGRAAAIESGAAGDDDTAAKIIADNDYGTALRMILDPGVSPDGCKILDTICELTT